MGGDSKFWVSFGSIWLLVGLGFTVVSVGALLTGAHTEGDEPPLIWVFLPVGLALATVGGFIICRLSLAVAARDKRLLQSGIQLTATVTGIRRSPIDINRQARWHVLYRYEYTTGRILEGKSRSLPDAAVERFRPAIRCSSKSIRDVRRKVCSLALRDALSSPYSGTSAD